MSRNGLSRHRLDVCIAFTLFTVAALAVFVAAGALDPRLLDWTSIDVWFEADLPRVFENLVDRWSNHYRAKVHPIFALLLYPPVFVLNRLVGLDPFTAVRIVFALLGGLWFAAFYVLLRLIGNRRREAIVFSLVAATSSSTVFWFAVPETHTLGSLTIVLAMMLIAIAAHRKVPVWIDATVSALTLGVTVTNWMAGIASTVVRATLSRRPIVRTLAVTASAFVLVIGMWGVAKQLMPSSAFFLGNEAEAEHILSPESRGPPSVTASFFLHTVVMPAIEVVDRPGAGQWPIMLTQPAAPGSAGGWSAVSVAIWVALLGMGVIALARLRRHKRLRVFLALVIAGQLALHLAFGNETFLYSPNFLPLLLVLPALAALTPMRSAVMVLAVGLIVTNGVNNIGQRVRAGRFLYDYEDMRHDDRQAQYAPPGEVYSGTGAAKVRITAPGAGTFDRGSFERGGSFSPGIDQFSMSFWVTDAAGAVTSGKDVGMLSESAVVQAGVITGMNTVTPAYEAKWRAIRPRQWHLTLKVATDDERVSLVVRSVGPESGPIRSLDWDGRRLLINDRWILTPSRPLRSVYLVEEGADGWMTATPSRRRIEVESGWAAARLELPADGYYTFAVSDELPDAPIDRPIGRITANGDIRIVSALSPAEVTRRHEPDWMRPAQARPVRDPGG